MEEGHAVEFGGGGDDFGEGFEGGWFGETYFVE